MADTHMKKRKKKARVWSSDPAPWRQRAPEKIPRDLLAEAQRQLERSIGWGSERAYDKTFAFNFGSPMCDDENFRNIILCWFKWAMPDLQDIEWTTHDQTYGCILKGRVKGVTPKLKRVRWAGRS